MITKERFFYSSSIKEFLVESEKSILGKLAAANVFDLDINQRNAWQAEIFILKRALEGVRNGHILFEYTIPRMGRRIDAVVIIGSVVAVIEFKFGSSSFDRNAIDQVVDYALDLKYFHVQSHDAALVPIVIATEAKNSANGVIRFSEDHVAEALRLAPGDLASYFHAWSTEQIGSEINPEEWVKSAYRPTPTIIEAAQALFREHTVEDLSRSDASAINLERTTARIGEIIDRAKSNGTKNICLITGVPGAGKTLAGLAIANSRQQFEEEEHAVFLSGNGPLVLVLQEALARDQVERGLSTTKAESLRRARSFIQAVHLFRDDALSHADAPHERVAIFDEAQRAWDAEQLGKFMKSKRGVPGFAESEPEFLIGYMDRHDDWAVIVCLIGEGQEIHTGEAGIVSWLNALERRYTDWHLHTSTRIHNDTYARGANLSSLFQKLGPHRVHFEDSLHLDVSIRSFRSERLSAFVDHLLLNRPVDAKRELEEIIGVYPVALTRDVDKARAWVRSRARGTERYGLIANSGAKRLRPNGIWVDHRNDPREWFLNGKGDVRSSYALEITATEFDVQGLEIDWSVVAWDGDLRFRNGRFEHWGFKGTTWQKVRSVDRQTYLTNAYRVLLTRARQGMVIYVPPGDANDHTRDHSYYDGTFEYLRSVGIPEI